MQLTIHRGTHEIGGSCVEVSTAATRIVLDLGMPLVDAALEPFDQQSIRGKSTEELLACGVLPRVTGLFDASPAPQAIFLSHAHLDHVGLLQYSRPEIQVHASEGTSKLMLAGAVFAGRTELPRERYHQVQHEVPVTIGDMRITPFSVDHSAYDSMAFLVEAEGKAILYSGDFRAHGRKPWMIANLREKAGKRKIDVLVTEGTHLGSDSVTGITEVELQDNVLKHIKEAPGIVLPCFSPTDVDRLVTFYKVTRNAGRMFVVDAYAAFIMYLVAKKAHIPPPKRENGVCVYYNQTFLSKPSGRLHEAFQEDRIFPEEILANPSRYVMTFRPSIAELDFKGVLPKRCRCVYSYWKGYLVKEDWVTLQKQVQAANGDFIHAHTSGHIFIDDLRDFVQAVKPGTIVPMHTFKPQELQNFSSNVQLLNDGSPYAVP